MSMGGFGISFSFYLALYSQVVCRSICGCSHSPLWNLGEALINCKGNIFQHNFRMVTLAIDVQRGIIGLHVWCVLSSIPQAQAKGN